MSAMLSAPVLLPAKPAPAGRPSGLDSRESRASAHGARTEHSFDKVMEKVSTREKTKEPAKPDRDEAAVVRPDKNSLRERTGKLIHHRLKPDSAPPEAPVEHELDGTESKSRSDESANAESESDDKTSNAETAPKSFVAATATPDPGLIALASADVMVLPLVLPIPESAASMTNSAGSKSPAKYVVEQSGATASGNDLSAFVVNGRNVQMPEVAHLECGAGPAGPVLSKPAAAASRTSDTSKPEAGKNSSETVLESLRGLAAAIPVGRQAEPELV